MILFSNYHSRPFRKKSYNLCVNTLDYKLIMDAKFSEKILPPVLKLIAVQIEVCWC